MELNKRAMKLWNKHNSVTDQMLPRGQTALKEHLAVLHSETAGTTQQPRGEHRGTIKDCKIAGATTWQGQGNHTFTTLWINRGALQLNCHLVSLIFFHNDRKTQPPWLHVSAEFCFDLRFFSTVGKHISHVHVFFIFAKFKKRIKLLCAKLVVLTCLMRL